MLFHVDERDINECRYFCHHELGAEIDSDGGICQLDLIDCYTYKGTVFPDEVKMPIFSRDFATQSGHATYGAGIQLYTQESDGRVLLHRPTEQRFTVSYLQGGDALQSYAVLLDDNRVLFECTCASEKRQDLLLYLNRTHLFCDTLMTHKDHHRGEGTTQIGDHYKEAGVELDVDLPELNGTATVNWVEDGFDEHNQVLLYRGEIAYPYGQTQYVMAVGADAPIMRDEAPNVTLLRMAWDDRAAIRVGMAIAHDKDEAIEKLRAGLSGYTALRDAQLQAQQEAEDTAVRVHCEALPAAETFCQASAAYLDALMVGPTENGRIGLRASVGKYGFFSLWDAIYPVRDLLWNGRYADAKRAIDYLLRLPAMENTPIAAMHAITQWNEVRAFVISDNDDDLYPILCKIFRFGYRLTEPQYRLLLCKGNTGVDRPHQMGLSGMFLSPDVNGLWYNACRVVRNEACKRGDEEIVRLTTEVIEGIEQGFRRVFFDEAVGYLRAGADRDLKPAAVDVFHNSLTLGYDYPYGMYLMRDMVEQLAHYQSHELWHPLGHRAVAFDSAMPVEWWKFVHMNQHNGHEMKVQRMADNMAEVYRVMGETMKRFDRWKVAEETTNFSKYAIAAAQVCDWQTFAATGNMEALRAGVAGLLRHRGGVCYLPAQDDADVTVRGVPMGDRTVDFCVTGEGSFATLFVNGREIGGTLQVPSDVTMGDIQIKRTDRLPTYPVLLSAIDMPITNVTASDRQMTCVCADTAHTPMMWRAATCPTVTVNGEPITGEWDGEVFCVDRLWHKGDRITVE
ncbi:MAG: hypothetical protein IJP14_01150 [Clostridia bacterium]|nr:hypothetical protein [Clostridia bacterium]